NGSYEIRLTVSDEDGGSTTVSQTITVANVAPTATINGAPASSLPGTSISLTSTVTDPSSVDTATGFTLAWSVLKNGASYTTGTGSSFTFTPNDYAIYTVTLTATDKDGDTGTSSVTILTQRSIYVMNPTAAGALTISGDSSIEIPGLVAV